MLNEKLMEVLGSIQSSICLEPEKKLAYAITGDFAILDSKPTYCEDCTVYGFCGLL